VIGLAITIRDVLAHPRALAPVGKRKVIAQGQSGV